jgi:prevent-host-death family protein
MSKINMHEAKTTLSRLVDRVAEGEEIVIARNGEPVAILSPYRSAPRKPGRLKGKLRMAKGFDAPLPAALGKAFRGEPR